MFTSPNYIHLSQLSHALKAIISDNFSHNFWVVAEIAQLQQARSGHVYLELVEKDEQQTIAKIQAVIWSNSYLAIKKKLGKDTHNLLKQGNKVLFKVQIDFHVVYGLKLKISDLDPSVTLGALEMRRLAIINRLEAEGLSHLNAEQSLPLVLQRIAVISSATAAGYGDFLSHISKNPYGYILQHTLFQSSMQGDNVSHELRAQLTTIAHHSQHFDAVVIIRGGGSKLDLDCFNNYEIAKAMALFPIPIITGIGHQQDDTIADLVAHTALKTPTAVAEYLLNSFAQFEYQLSLLLNNLSGSSTQQLTQQQYLLQTLQHRLSSYSRHYTTTQNHQLDKLQHKLSQHSLQNLAAQKLQLSYLLRTFKLFNVDSLLRRGFSITRKNGQVLLGNSPVAPGDTLSTSLSDGKEITSIVR